MATTTPKAYVEHVAIWVRDIRWHIKFFHDVFGMTLREVQGPVDRDHRRPARTKVPAAPIRGR